MSIFDPSPQQHAIFTSIASPTGGSIAIEAVAGSGKTTTIVHGLSHIPQDGFIPPAMLFLAFNKMIAETLKARCPKGVSCSTFHSLGLSALRPALPCDFNFKTGIDGRKVSKLVWNTGAEKDDVPHLIKLVDLCKQTPQAPHDLEDSFFQDLISRFDIDLSSDASGIRTARAVLAASTKNLNSIDFSDMLYLPVILDLPFTLQDWIFVDEAQDTNDIQVEILSRLSGPRTRHVIVGDPRQAIYGFRGSNSDAMHKIARRFNCTSFPLSVSYRCPKAVVREALKYLTKP